MYYRYLRGKFQIYLKKHFYNIVMTDSRSIFEFPNLQFESPKNPANSHFGLTDEGLGQGMGSVTALRVPGSSHKPNIGSEQPFYWVA